MPIHLNQNTGPTIGPSSEGIIYIMKEPRSEEPRSEERIQKLMAQAGLGSRRACEALISAGRVTVNGRVAELGEKADSAQDRILVDGQPLRLNEPPVYIAMYKPRGVLSAVSAPDPRPTVRDLVDLPGRLYPVGRLDVDSEGLILLTNDGNLANHLTHPRYGHEKEYRVLVAARPDDEQLQTWRRGVVLADGYRTQPAEVRMEETFGRGAWLRIILREGRKRQIRETGSQLGLPVVKIIRVRMGTLYLIGLKPGEWRNLTPEEILDLKRPPAPTGRTLRRASVRHSAETPDAEERSSTGRRSSQPAKTERRPAQRDEPGAAHSLDRRSPGANRTPGGGRRSPGQGRSSGGSHSRPRSSGQPGSEPARSGSSSSRRPSGRPGVRSGGSQPAGGRSSGRRPATGRPAGPRPPGRKKPSSK